MTDTPTQGTGDEYTHEHIRALGDIEGIRLRPEMYIGGTDTHGLHHLVYELVSNSVDEAVNGHGSFCAVVLNADGSCTVIDDGRGIPVGNMPDMGNRSALEVVFTETHAGGKFDRTSGYSVGTGGLHGVGIKAVNACSEWLEVEVRREGHVWTMEFARGEVASELTRLGKTDETGTKITFMPDPDIFPDPRFSYEMLHRSLQDAAFLNAGLRIRISDERTGQSDEFHYENGLVEFVQHLNRTETSLFNEVVYIEGAQETEQGEVGVSLALQYNDGFSENVRCYCNGIYNAQGGTHLSGFRSGLTRTLNAYGTKTGAFKVPPTGEDFREGLAAVITVRHPDPRFEAQTKIKLSNSEVAGIVESVVNRELSRYLEENPAVARIVVTKAVTAAEARVAAKKARDMIRDTKGNTTTGGLPEKLRDCRSRKLEETELYLVEGDSAGGSADTGRDSNTQAILPLRGKILNVEKAQLVKVLGNNEVAALFKAIDVSPDPAEQDVSKRRYGKLIVMTDADVDGSHIRTLLLTFLFRHMPELVREGCVFIAQPPLYRVLPKSGRKKAQPRYVQTEEQMMRELVELGLEGARLDYELDGKALEFEGQRLEKLVELCGKLEEPLRMLDLRGVDLKHVITSGAAAGNRLPRYRVYLGSEQHWFVSKQELDQFVQQEESRRGEELRVADEQSPTQVSGNGQNGARAPVLQVVDLHEVRSINNCLDDLLAFGFELDCLYEPDLREGEPVRPFTLVRDETSLHLGSLRDLLPAIREQGGKGLIYTRFKGLGEMDSDELWTTSMDPETRTLLQVTMEDAAAADEIFRVLMGDHVEPRREFIEKHALEVKDLDV